MNLLTGGEEVRPSGHVLHRSCVRVGDGGDVQFVSQVLLDVLSEMLSQVSGGGQVGRLERFGQS